eukprot:1856243-Amphidinium_carterae.1
MVFASSGEQTTNTFMLVPLVVEVVLDTARPLEGQGRRDRAGSLLADPPTGRHFSTSLCLPEDDVPMEEANPQLHLGKASPQGGHVRS